MDKTQANMSPPAGPTNSELVKFAKESHTRCNGTGIQGYTDGQAIICPCAVKGWQFDHPLEAAQLKGQFERELGGSFVERKPTHGPGKRKRRKR